MTTQIQRVFLAATLLFALSAHAEFLGEDAMFTGLRIPTKGTSGLPKGLKNQDQAFTVSDANDSLAMVDEAREPASVPNRKSNDKKLKSQHWSASTSDGFEFKIRVKNQISAVWVMKRSDHYDFIFANNAGSRVNLSLPAEQFYALKNAATDLRSPASDTTKCKDAFIQLEMVETGTRKLVSTCLNTKSKSADELRRFGSALTAIVR